MSSDSSLPAVDEASPSDDVLVIQTALRDGLPLADEVFDRQYPRMARFRSTNHWTPIEVARRVARMLAATPGGHVLDVGAGVGKACIIGALTTSVTWHGMERNESMVRTARQVARRLGVVDRTSFVAGEANLHDWSMFGGFYLYNPFAESLFTGRIRDPGLRREAYLDEVGAVERKLALTAPGTRVVTYHGFGGDMPEGFELVEREPAIEDEICLWIRQ